MNEDVFTGSIDELLEHVTDNQEQLIKDIERNKKNEYKMFERMLETMVEEGILKKEKINGETFYTKNEEEKL